VLGRAIEKQAAKQASGKLGFDDLLAVAAEVGVDAESLRAASRDLRAPAAPPAPLSAPRTNDAQAWLRRRRRALHRHAGVYAIVNGALLVLGLVLLPWTPWWAWFIPGLAWGIGLAIHALVVLSTHEDDWKARNDEIQRWQERRERRHQERMAALGVGRAPKRRFEAPPEPAHEKVRVVAPVDTERERDAEEEAALADPAELRRKR